MFSVIGQFSEKRANTITIYVKRMHKSIVVVYFILNSVFEKKNVLQ